jgi:hypothetical protein
MRFFQLLKTRKCSSQAKAGEQIGIQRSKSKKLWGRYQKEGLAALLVSV